MTIASMPGPDDLRAGSLDVWSMFEAAAGAAPDRCAISFVSKAISFRALHAQAVAIRAALEARGIGRLDRVATLVPNTPLTVAIHLAVAAVGGTLVPINTRLAAREVGGLINEARPALFVLDPQYEKLAALATATAATLRTADLMREIEGALRQPGAAGRSPVRIDPGDPCIIFYTSGTTGRPKGVIRTQQNVCCSVLVAMWMQDFRHDTVLLAPLPLFHISGWETKFLSCLLAGGRSVLMERYDAEDVLAHVERHQVTHLFVVPTMTHDLVRLDTLEGRNLGSLRYWQSGTAPLPMELREQVVRKLPDLEFRISYGTTEAGIISFLPHPQRDRGPGCVGRVIPSVHLRIVDDDGRDTATGESGEIWCRSPMITPGLFAGDGKAPTPATNVANWLATGDLGRLDDEGFLFVSGRKKDVIISGGENVVAAEVEEVLKAHPRVADAAVIGTPDARWGESVMAFVVVLPGTTLERGALDSHCRGLLAGYKCPRRVEIIESLPRTSIGKVAKGVLRDLAAKLHATQA